jgi:hypothetical protein
MSRLLYLDCGEWRKGKQWQQYADQLIIQKGYKQLVK